MPYIAAAALYIKCQSGNSFVLTEISSNIVTNLWILAQGLVKNHYTIAFTKSNQFV